MLRRCFTSYFTNKLIKTTLEHVHCVQCRMENVIFPLVSTTVMLRKTLVATVVFFVVALAESLTEKESCPSYLSETNNIRKQN